MRFNLKMSLSIPTKELKLSVPWGHIAAKAWGDEEAQRVLVVHGRLDNAGSFDRLIPLLPRDRYYVVPDLPGHGLSSAFPSGVQLDYMNYVYAIRVILDALKWEHCVYIGHSLGAQLGIFMEILCPGRITKMACLDGLIPNCLYGDALLKTMRDSQNTTMIANKRIESPLYTKEEILYALTCRRDFPLNTPAAEALFVRSTTKVGDLYKYNRDYRFRGNLNPMMGTTQYTQLLKYLKIPIFLIVAESSWFNINFDDHVVDQLKKIMGNNYTIVHVKGNHDVHNNHPEIVAPHLWYFLNDVTKSKL